MRRACARTWRLAAAAGLVTIASGGATAQPVNTRLEYWVSRDEVNWFRSIEAHPGQRVAVKAVVSYVGSASAPTAAGLGQIVFQPVISNWYSPEGDAADRLVTYPVSGMSVPEPPGAVELPCQRTRPPFPPPPPPLDCLRQDIPGYYGRIQPFMNSAVSISTYLRGHIGSGTAAGLMRIARADITNWIGVGLTSGAGAANNWNGGGGVACAQIAAPSRLSTDPPFSENLLHVALFRFAFDVGDATHRTMLVFTPPEGIGKITTAGTAYGQQNCRWFPTTSSTQATYVGGCEVIDATIRVTPACNADLTGDGIANQDDVDYMVGLIAGESPNGVDPDFNHDGNVDQQDVRDVIGRIAGADCP